MFDPRWEEAAAARAEADGPRPGLSHASRPSTARVQVRELSWRGLHNPSPQSKAPGGPGRGLGEQLVEDYLSPARLQALAQVSDLRQVTVLELRVDTREHSLGSFGVHLPKLSQLKLNGSRLGSVRDLGTSLGHLRVLWLARCGLADLDGVGSFPALRELYASFNDVSDLSPLCLLDQLEVLDLEGNGVEDLGQVRYLQLCPRLATLTLQGNLVCLRPGPVPHHEVTPDYNYRAEVRRLIPQLRVLDDVPVSHTGPPASPKLDQDWLTVTEAIKGGGVLEGRLPQPGRPREAPVRSHDPEPPLPEPRPPAPRPWPFSLLAPGGPLPEGLLPTDAAPEDDTSALTHGASRVLCGNPTKGLWERRRRGQAQAPLGQPPHRPKDPATGAATPAPDPADGCGLLSTAGLRAWREAHLWCLGSQQERATVPPGPRRSLEEQEARAGPRNTPGHPAPAPGTDCTSPAAGSPQPAGHVAAGLHREHSRAQAEGSPGAVGSKGPGDGPAPGGSSGEQEPRPGQEGQGPWTQGHRLERPGLMSRWGLPGGGWGALSAGSTCALWRDLGWGGWGC
ncbi:leucine-rich repeat-containing protein 56 [Talpa occidentalis]|uniref:leucine-rich repeat-containing protein 56 n=1 Tax=Talpa occidentalis TaxID=50954 RepID=UPI00188F792B|nr:leucine-rich repeat-containing protein 56 [Talpa occidentalis]